MNRRLLGLVCTLTLAISASATGCFGRYAPCPEAGQRLEGRSTKDLAGTYRSAVGRLTLSSDGTLTALGWPANLEGAIGDPQSRTGSGTRKRTPADGSDWPVLFTFHRISGYWDSDVSGGYYGDGLHVSGSRENPHLYRYVGDPDSCELDTFMRNRWEPVSNPGSAAVG
ncbi:hypothetical protein [Streptomyces sp. t39]|uniref:hypothetical protein n=1 Tax=Streptomyces sp. t39 TaxID=1828156 RepID=UPI0011CE03C6|nr:hypothetical protein [Streptomyces sp. t39]TXS49076.1 hypothetical protein EAO77_29170 [Streptomyces sp. t39]